MGQGRVAVKEACNSFLISSTTEWRQRRSVQWALRRWAQPGLRSQPGLHRCFPQLVNCVNDVPQRQSHLLAQYMLYLLNSIYFVIYLIIWNGIIGTFIQYIKVHKICWGHSRIIKRIWSFWRPNSFASFGMSHKLYLVSWNIYKLWLIFISDLWLINRAFKDFRSIILL